MKVFITSALPYCNFIPHLGNIIGSTLSGDVYARYKREQGHEVVYLCGTDEYGSTTMIKAKKEGLTCKEICDKYHKLHKEVYDWFNIKFDVWGRTSTQMQTKLTHEIFLELYKNGFIEGKTITQKYCEHCKMFLADRYIKGTCYHTECADKNNIANGDQCDFCQKVVDTNKLINPFCDLCKSKPIEKETDHLFLRLDLLAPMVESYVNNSNFKFNVLPIAKSWLSMGLLPRCITRDLDWGTPVPKGIDPFLDKFSNKVFYVWFDAPIGYYSILANAKPDWREFLQSKDLQWISTQAKDNIPFHTIFFPATMLGSKLNYPLITDICATDYLLYEGKKFSKSNGIGLFGDQVISISNKLGINEDYWRYYLVRIRPENFQDSSFAISDFVQTIKSELIHNIGNLVNRCVSLSRKYCNGRTYYRFVNNPYDFGIVENYRVYTCLMDMFQFRDALRMCLEQSNYGNSYLQNEKPWDVAKTDIVIAHNIICKATMVCWILLMMLQPIIPATTDKLLSTIKCNLSKVEDIFEGKHMIIEISNDYEIPFKPIDPEEIQKLVL